jgi:glycosyltransferase involved in cell wall biosynthesis
MRIVQAVPLASDDGAFGGPLSVAVAQSRALTRRGHDVVLVGGWKGSGPPPTSWEGIEAALFNVRAGPPGTGFSGLTAPGLNRWWRSNAHSVDVVHVHTGRHLVTLSLGRSVRRSGVPLVVQTHGMLPPNRRLDGRVLDRLLTRGMLQAARSVLTLTDTESAELRTQFGRQVTLTSIVNGIEIQTDERRKQFEDPPELLFLGRLQERKRPVDLVHAARLLRDRGLSFRLSFVGPDEGQRDAISAAIHESGLEDVATIHDPLPHGDVLTRLRTATVFVLPSVNEPFPMTLLEALSVGTAAVTTTSSGIADLLVAYDAAGVVEPSPGPLAAEIGKLLTDHALRQRRTKNGKQLILERLSVDTVAGQLETLYQTNHEASRGDM